MTSLGKRYERLKKIHEELGIQYALLAPIPEQALSQSSGRKRKHMELGSRGMNVNMTASDSVKDTTSMMLDKLGVREGATKIQGAGASGASCDESPKAIPLMTVGDLDVLIRDIEAGKHEELLSGMTNDKRMAVMDTLSAMCDLIKADNSLNDPIVQSAYIHEKPSSYV
ncbi:hypothetical protein Tco_0784939, partial [Tanacetum coccineum]